MNPFASAFRSSINDALRLNRAADELADRTGVEPRDVLEELARRAALSSRSLTHVIDVLRSDVAEGNWPPEPETASWPAPVRRRALLGLQPRHPRGPADLPHERRHLPTRPMLKERTMTVEDFIPLAYLLAGALIAVGVQWCADVRRRRLERDRLARRSTAPPSRLLDETDSLERWHYPRDVA